MRAAAPLIALCVALATTAATQEPPVAPRPNIVFILADDLTGWERLWRGLGMVVGLVAAVAGLLVLAVVLVVRRLRRRRRRRP